MSARLKLHRFPDSVISYHQDVINDIAEPLKLEQAAWTGSLFRLESSDLLNATARMQHRFYDCLPRMLNSIAPRGVLEAIIARYGDVFVSTAPDLCFAYRFLERFDSLLYLDQALMTQYALHRSNGMSQALGKATKDHKDFMASIDGEVINYASPIPGLNTNMNTVVHEYCLVKRVAQRKRFPEIDVGNYMEYVRQEVAAMDPSPTKSHMNNLVAAYRRTLPQQTRRLNHEWHGLPSQVSEHASVEAAMEFANQQPRSRNWSASNVETMTDPRLVVGAQGALILYLRFLLVRAKKGHERFRQALDRHVMWRFRSA